jgi:phospholipid transport system substrate-binding protein
MNVKKTARPEGRRVAVGFALLMVLAGAPVLPVATAAAATTAAGVDTSGPAELIRSASDVMLKDLDANRAAYRKDRTKLYELVDRVLLPNFDVNFAAQQVLGKYWRTADAQQRDRFVKAFYRSLMQTYSDAMIEFTGDRIRFLPFQGDPAATRATVRTEVRRDGGSSVKVNYTLRKTEAGWKAFDVVIEGISYVKSFQEDFAAELDQKGIDSLTQRLESGGTAARPASRT